MNALPPVAQGTVNAAAAPSAARPRAGHDAPDARGDHFASLLGRDLAAMPKTGDAAEGRAEPGTQATPATPAELAGKASPVSGQATAAHGAHRAVPATPATPAKPRGDPTLDAASARPGDVSVDSDEPRAAIPAAGLDADAGAATDEAPATMATTVDPAPSPVVAEVAPARPAAVRAMPADPAPLAQAAHERRSATPIEPGAVASTRAGRHEVRGKTADGREPVTDDLARGTPITPGVKDGTADLAPTSIAGVRPTVADVAVATLAPATGAAAAPATTSADALAIVATAGVESASSHAAPSSATPAEARLPHPPQSPAFAAALGQQVSLWIRRGVQQAVLQLNPAELGPVAIHIALDGARAHVDFTAPHAATRAALEASLPALAGALRDSGLTLAGGGVFDRPREQADGNAGAPAWAGDSRHDDAPRGKALPPSIVMQRRGVVDLVA